MVIKFGDFVDDNAFERKLREPAAPFYGRLKSWKSGRFFGFVERDDRVDVFVHGSTLEAAGIEPMVGMRLAFESATDHLGRQRVTRVWADPERPEAA